MFNLEVRFVIMNVISHGIQEDRGDQWRRIYGVGAVSTVIAIMVVVADIVIASLTGGSVTALPHTAAERFAQFHQAWWLGLYNLDFLNMLNQLILIPTYFAVYAVHREVEKAFSLLALVIFLVGTTIFVANNSALSMFDLSIKYYSSAEGAQRDYLAAAGEAMLARSAHGSMGAFIGFLLPNIAGMVMSFAMLKGNIFGKVNSYAGILGSLLLTIYIILVTFNTDAKDKAMLFAMPGGILVLIWMVLTARRLVSLRKDSIY